jgi:hypothetical protein
VRLARESSANKVNCFEVMCPAFSDVTILRHLRPVFRKHALAIVVNLHLPGTFHPGTLQTQVQPTDTSEE